jgi:hypothetical protein
MIGTAACARQSPLAGKQAGAGRMSGLPDLEKYDGLGLAELVRTRQVSAEEVVEAAIERIEARNPIVNAVVTRMYDEARTAVRAGLPAGPFEGVPYLLKDLGALGAAALRADAQSLGACPQRRRVQWRRSRRRGLRHAADGPCDRRWRLHPHPGVLLRPLRP